MVNALHFIIWPAEQSCDKVWFQENIFWMKRGNIYEILQVISVVQNAYDAQFFVDNILSVEAEILSTLQIYMRSSGYCCRCCTSLRF